MTPKKTKWLDVASMGLSSLCVVHCLALPFLVAALPFLGIFSQNELVHQILVSIAAPLSALALWRSGGWRRWDVVAPMTVGLLMLAAAAFILDLEPVEAGVSVVGALLVAAGHIINFGGLKAFHRHSADCPCDV